MPTSNKVRVHHLVHQNKYQENDSDWIGISLYGDGSRRNLLLMGAQRGSGVAGASIVHDSKVRLQMYNTRSRFFIL
jgi:hypothetical protein